MNDDAKKGCQKAENETSAKENHSERGPIPIDKTQWSLITHAKVDKGCQKGAGLDLWSDKSKIYKAELASGPNILLYVARFIRSIVLGVCEDLKEKRLEGALSEESGKSVEEEEENDD